MKIQDVIRPSKKKGKIISINLKITKEVSDFLRINHLSPTLIFDNAIEELIFELKNNDVKK